MVQLLQRRFNRDIHLQGDKLATNPGLLCKFNQILAALILLNFTCARQQGVQIAIFIDQESGRFHTNTRHAGHIIHAVTSQRLHINDLVRLDPKFVKAGLSVQGFLLHRIPQTDAWLDQLHQVFVTADDDHVATCCFCLRRIGRNQIIGFKSLLFNTGQIERARRVTDHGKLWAQVLGWRVPVGLVLIVNIIAECIATGVKDDDNVIVWMIVYQAHQHG